MDSSTTFPNGHRDHHKNQSDTTPKRDAYPSCKYIHILTLRKRDQHYLCESLLARGTTKFGHSGDDFARGASGHHLGGKDRNRGLHA